MKRFFALALLFGSFSTLGFVGCSEETKVKEEKTISTPDGEKKETNTSKIETSGDMKPEKSGEAPK